MGLFDGTVLERPVKCEECGKLAKECICVPAPPADVEPQTQRLKVRLDKRKRGKLMTVISGFSCSQVQMQRVLTELKDQCGAGGTIDGSNVEIQGDHVRRAVDLLKSMRYRV